jgi:hypothetical protein
MKTYRVTTVQKTVQVYNVIGVEPSSDGSTIVFYRTGGTSVQFPLVNVIAYEATEVQP